jgi:hypothetical protein
MDRSAAQMMAKLLLDAMERSAWPLNAFASGDLWETRIFRAVAKGQSDLPIRKPTGPTTSEISGRHNSACWWASWPRESKRSG